jgi:hypothetical protein
MARLPGSVPRPLVIGVALAAAVLNAWLIKGALRDGRETAGRRRPPATGQP